MDKLNPDYYREGIETIDYIEAKGFNYHLGNAIKYISRAGKKDNKVDDLRKAIWYIEREIDKTEKDIDRLYRVGGTE